MVPRERVREDVSGGLLIVAAMREELAALRAVRPRVPATLVVVGETAARAAPALEKLIERRKPAAVLILGVCGGLQDDLGPADLVVPDRVGTPEADAPPPDARWLGLPRFGRRGRLVSIPRVAGSAAEKRELADRLGADALAIDLETAALAEVTHRHGVPYLVLRSVSDTVDESMPAFVAKCFREDGSMSRLAVVRSALFRPGRWKILLAMRRRMARCSRALRDAALVAIPRHYGRKP